MYCYQCKDEIAEWEDYYVEAQYNGKIRYIHKDECLDNYILDQEKQDYIDGMELVVGDF